MRGLSPEEPTQQGGYYAASIGLFGKTQDLNPASGNQKTDTFSVTLASALPRIAFPLNGNDITLVPFAKTVGGCGGVSAAQGSYQPTNTIVDFYVDTITNTDLTNIDTTVNGGRPYAKFRINYEDSEYGSDHDMDAIAEYELTAKADNTLDIKVSSNYAAGSCIQHMGYVISGTSADGIYLEVRDPDTGSGSDVDYYLDTPHNRSGVALPTTSTRNFTLGTNTSAAFVAHDPLWYAAKWGGFIDSNDNNLLDATEWDTRDGADGVPDSYFLVTNASKLKEQLDRAFTEILARDSSASAVATNSTSLNTHSRVYQAKYNSLDWSGQLLSCQLSASDEETCRTPAPEWDAGVKINSQDPITGRVIITKGDTGDGVPFDYANLTGPTATAGTQMNLLDKDAASPPVTDNCGPERIAYLRGDQTNEAVNGTFTCASGSIISKFRQRATSKLGDIVNSNPWYVGAPSAGFSDVDYPGYSAFRQGKLTRKPVVYTGGNDGMLHGFDASLDTSTVSTGVPTATSGNEVLAYLPGAVFPNLSKLTAQTYNQTHQYFVDGSPMIGDVDLTSSNWHTVLVGAMAAGGKGYYALDITDPSSFLESNAANILLWEFNDADDADIGYAFNLPPASPVTGQAKQIERMANGQWAAIVGNGYNSSLGKAVLYILFINDGVDGIWGASDYVKIIADAPVGLDNGLSTPVPFDSNDDGFVDTVYAGDLKGNMWKFLVGPNSSDASITSTPSTWKVAFSGAPLFTATDSGGVAQPIVRPPEVTLHPSGGQMILFGTGKYLETDDKTNTDSQTFYGIWDRDVVAGTPVGARATDLLQQTVTESALAAGNFRIPSNTPINWRPAAGVNDPANCSGTCTPTHRGWYMDLPATGERTTGIPKLINQVIFFNTLIPSSTICSPGTGWLMSLNYLNGGLVDHRVFDTGGNGVINDSDAQVGGYQVGAAIGGTIIILGDDTINSTGISCLTDGSCPVTDIGGLPPPNSRFSWRELLQ
jgi:type IV pilus assembly protein PilY1